jgi:hypothetical protein
MNYYSTAGWFTCQTVVIIPQEIFFETVPKRIMARVFLLCHDDNKTLEKYGFGTVIVPFIVTH